MNWNVGAGGNPARNCLSSAYGPETATLLWNGTLPALRGYQTCIDGDIVVTSRRFNYSNALHGAKIVAHSLQTGDTLWTAELPVADPDNENFSQVKGARDGKVYGTRADGIGMPSPLYALDINTGSLLWQSDAMMTTSFSEDISFAPNGDVIIGNFNEIIRVDQLSGDVIWTVPRYSPTSDGSNVAVFGDRCYGWEASPSGPMISVFDLASGTYLYSSDAVSAGLIQQTGLFTGPDGTVYAPRTQNNPATDFFASYTDTGSALIKNWDIPYGYAIWATSGVGPDGTVYTYSTAGSVIALDPENGEVLYTSEQIINAFPAGPKMAIGTDGILYVTNGEYGNEKLFSFNGDLTTRWVEEFNAIVLEGPSLAYDGTLVVCAGGTEMRSYQGQGMVQLFAEFEADTAAGVAPFEAHFKDLSQGINTSITNWAWDFDSDGIIDNLGDPEPIHVYNEPGIYSVTLIAMDEALSDTMYKEDYITVAALSMVPEMESTIAVYPNPFDDLFQLEADEPIDETKLYNLHGQEVYSERLSGRTSVQVSPGPLPDGQYILKTTLGKKVIFKRLVKQGS